MGSTNKKLRGKLEDCVRAMRTGREAVSIARRYVPNEWKRTMLNAIEYLTEQISNNKMGTFNSGLNKDDDELPKQEYKMAENEKHFEPVTAMNLAKRIFAYTAQGSYNVDRISDMIEPHIRKPSDDDKSVPERCEEAYNGAINLLASARDLFVYMNSKRGNSWVDMYRDFINKPNPFKEADIVREGETDPTKTPFSLEEARNGAQVVTRKGIPARIVADDLNYDAAPIAAIIHDEGKKMLFRYEPNGFLDSPKENDYDLFILKEPEIVEIGLYRYKHNGIVIAHRINTHWNAMCMGHPEESELIKTIKTTI